MNPLLNEIHSIINGYNNAKDKERVFTYIEFVKQFGYDNDTNIFISVYKDYVTQWGIVKKDSITLSDEEFVMKKMIDVLKSITLDYSSYEEQDFIAHINLQDKEHLKGLCALYSRKIREITEYYRKKRNESSLIVHRNSAKGSVKSVQEVIYEKIFDFIFSNRNIVPSYKNIKRDLIISVENYVDTYSEYFDIPRQKEFTDRTRAEMLSANINDVDYRVYIEIQLVISEILFSGNVWLEEIPLIAQIGADLSQSCVGDMLMLKNQLTANTTVNQVDLDEQVALKRKLYEKFLGCDLYYMYVDLQGNIKIDRLCKAQNPSGNLLNVGTADTATVENEQLELLTHIGLFFKPDKTSILKVNAKDYTWEVDRDSLINDTVYVFPDPEKYGDIGNNKNPYYPLIMRCKLDYDIKNFSSGFSENDPIAFITDQAWYSYYSKQQDDFKVIDNKNYEYSLTSLANKGFLKDYQTDIWGNEFGILTGYTVAKDGDKITITLNPKYNEGGMKYNTFDLKESNYPLLLNGGYFANPLNKSEPFNFDRRLTLIDNENDKYSWSGLITDNVGFTHPQDTNFISFGEFGCHEGIKYTDHFEITFEHYESLPNDNIDNTTIADFLSHNLYDRQEVEVTFADTVNEGGELFVKLIGQKPKSFNEVFDWIKLNDEKFINISIVTKTLVLETDKRYLFIPYDYDGETIIDTLGIKELYEVEKDDKFVKTELLYNETDRCFYLLMLEVIDASERRFVVPRIYQFNPQTYKMKDILYPYDCVCSEKFIDNKIDQIKLFSTRIEEKDKISNENIKEYEYVLTSGKVEEFDDLSNFEIPYAKTSETKLNDISFSYNSSIGLYLISFSINDLNGTPYIYEHKFKLGDINVFVETLVSKVYTLKGDDGESYKWNDKIVPESVSTIPNNTNTKTENTIWENYVGNGNANSGFTQGEVDYTDKDFGSSNINWKSYVYDWDGYGYVLSKTRKVTGVFEFINNQNTNTLINGYTNKLTFKYSNLILTKSPKDTNNLPLYTHSGNQYKNITIEVKRDLLGAVQGDKTINFITIKKDTEKREITGEITLRIRGDEENPEITVTAIVRDYTNNFISDIGGGDNEEDDEDNKDDILKPEFVLEKNGTKLYIHSEVRDYDNILGPDRATPNVKKAIACNNNQWSLTFGNEDKKGHLGDNNCTLKIDRLMVVPCTEQRTGTYLDIPVKYDSGKGEIIEILQDGGFNFNLNLVKNNKGEVNGVISGNNCGSEISILDKSLKSSNGYILLKHSDHQDNSYTKWEDKHFTNGYEYSSFTNNALQLHLYGTIYLNTCQYNSWIAYDKFGVPIRFQLSKMSDMNALFANTSGTGFSFVFADTSDGSTVKPLKLTNTTNLAAALQNSDCSMFKIQNDICTNSSHVVSHCKKMFEFDVTTSNPNYVESLSNVVLARGMIGGYTFPNLERVKTRYKQIGLKDNNYSNKDPRYYAEWCEIIKNAHPKNKELFNNYNKEQDTNNWKTKVWIPALDNLKDRQRNFNYNMSQLLNGIFMMTNYTTLTKTDDTWPDETGGEDTVGSNTKYKFLEAFYEYSYGRELTLTNTRPLDFEQIYIKTPKLLSGVGMFWNRPLKVDEVKYFADSLRDLTKDQVELDTDVIKKLWTAYDGSDKSTMTYKEAFDMFIDDAFTVDTIKDYGNISVETRYNDQKNKILTYRNFIDYTIYSPFKNVFNGIAGFLYPNISIWFDTKNDYDESKAIEAIQIIANKGWEVSTNIDCTDVKSIRNTTLTIKNNNEYLIRAYEYSGLSGYVRGRDYYYSGSQSESQDYFIDFCKSVVNPIECKSWDSWIKLCLLWNKASCSVSRASWKNSVGVQQVIGTINGGTRLPGENRLDLYKDDAKANNNRYCTTWYKGTAKSFMEFYNLTII